MFKILPSEITHFYGYGQGNVSYANFILSLAMHDRDPPAIDRNPVSAMHPQCIYPVRQYLCIDGIVGAAHSTAVGLPPGYVV
jgi:hypothetical protein